MNATNKLLLTATIAAILPSVSLADGMNHSDSWTGTHFGIMAGGNIGHGKASDDDSAAGLTLDFTGYEFSGVLGYNERLSDHVIRGVDLDLGYASLDFDGASDDLDFYTARLVGRLGYLTSEKTMLYGMAGPVLGFSEVTNDDTETFGGITYGIGLEHLINENVSVRADWSNDKFLFSTISEDNVSVSADKHNFRLGLVFNR